MPRTQLTISVSLHPLLRIGIAATTALILLAGCGAGGGSGGVSIAGDNQSTDPGTVEYPIAYIRRPAPAQPVPQNQRNDLRNPFAFNPGAKLLVRSRADANAVETNVTDGLFVGSEDLYDVKDLAVSPDGTQLVFALHAPMDPDLDVDDPAQPSWDIWVYNFATKQINAVISSKNRSEGSDVAPHYLEDGRIVFVSDRQLKSREQLQSSGVPGYSGLVEAGANRKAGVLHIMNADGTGIDQISFNQSHDLSPAQLRNGKLVFTRWDNMNGNDRMDLYTVNPSGMSLSYLYGYNSHNTGPDATIAQQFSQPREMEDGRLVTIMRPNVSPGMGGDLVAIDVARYSDNNNGTWENSTLIGPAQQSLAANPVIIDPNPNPATPILSPGGEFGAVWPLFDGTGRLLISWSQCRALDEGRIVPCVTAPATATPAPLIYGIWIFDPAAGTQKPIVTAQEGVLYTDIVAASPAKTVTRATDPTATGTNDLIDYGNNTFNTLSTNNLAVLDIRSVYNLDGGVGNFGQTAPAGMISNQANPANTAIYRNRRARFIQVIEGVPLPDPNDEIPAANNQILEVPDFAFGQNGNFLRHIVGYAPIEADGSVAIQIPAEVPITFNILDENAQSISPSQHNVWWQFRAGEVVHCAGCHDAQNPASTALTHGRNDSTAPDSNPGVGGSGYFSGVSPSSAILTGTRTGQSIAEMYSSFKQAPRKLSVNVTFTDEYASIALKMPDVDYSYDIASDAAHPHRVPVPPTTNACQTNWTASCRIVINYLEHIQPIWDKSRNVDANGNALASDQKCVSCHAPVDALNVAQLPKGQLDLTSSASDRDNDRVLSFSELFTADIQQEQLTAGGAVTDVPDTIVVNADGTTTTTQHTVTPVMSAGSARNSARFFGCFNGGICGTSGGSGFDHTNLMTKSELRLISEWLDIGGQYYNDVVKAAAAQ